MMNFLKKLKSLQTSALKSKTNKETTVTMRAAMTIVELGLVIIIVGIILVGAFVGYQKLYLPQKAETEHKRLSGVIAGVERTKTLNNNVYPVGAGVVVSGVVSTTSGRTVLMNALGGAASIRDISTWTYTCAAGAGVTISIKTAPYDSLVVTNLVADMIDSNNAPWVSTVNGDNSITFSKANSVCQ